MYVLLYTIVPRPFKHKNLNDVIKFVPCQARYWYMPIKIRITLYSINTRCLLIHYFLPIINTLLVLIIIENRKYLILLTSHASIKICPAGDGHLHQIERMRFLDDRKIFKIVFRSDIMLIIFAQYLPYNVRWNSSLIYNL